MASLTIRNLTITPLELKHVARFDGSPAAREGGGLANITSSITSGVTGLFNATTGAAPAAPTSAAGVVPRGAARSSEEAHVAVGAFETAATKIRAASPGREVLRLTFAVPGRPGLRYTVDVPGATPRSSTLRREGRDGDADADADADADLSFTAVYLARAGFLALYSSARLDGWMAELDPARPLSQLSMPGTHNSPTAHKALPSVRCQAVGVRAQLDNGVRFLDVRVSVSVGAGAGAGAAGSDLALVHSAFPVSLTGTKYFADLLADAYAFLDAHPSEALVMSVKREGTGKGTDEQLGRHLRDRYCRPDRWFLEPRIPTLGEARGKILLIRRFRADDSLKKEHGGRGWGLDAAGWPDNCADGKIGSGLIRVQDFYEVGESTNIEKKIGLARAQLERAAEQQFPALAGKDGPEKKDGPKPLPFFVNFLTASNFFSASCWPEKIAAKINPAIVEYLCMRHGEHDKGPNKLKVGDAGTGIVVTDWVGHNGDWDLIRCIVGMNARLQLKK